MSKVFIIGLSCQLGSKVTTVEEIAKRFGTTAEEVQRKSGITKLYSLDEHEDIVDMTVACAKRVLDHNNIRLDQVNGIFGSSNPTTATLMPTFTVQVASQLGLKNVIADQIGIGCCGGLQALRNAYNQLMIDKKWGYYLVVAADQTNAILDDTNFATSILFSEGCAALLLTNDEDLHHSLQIHTIRTKSLLTDELSVESIRLKNPYNQSSLDAGLPMIEMDGSAIYKFGTTVLEDILECANMTLSTFKDMDMYLVPHQPNLRMLNAIMKNNNLTEKQIYIDGIKTIGNTSGPAVFFGLHDAISRELFDPEKWVILGTFGAELQVGGAFFITHRNLRNILC